MSRIEYLFKKGKAFIPFITAGDPSPEITKELILMMAEEGAGLVEIGIPFSDPIAEGPVIQAADERALNQGITVDDIFDMVKSIRTQSDIPLAFMTYVNPVLVYGPDRFMKNCSASGIDAVIVPDLPFEERQELKPFCEKYGIDMIYMIAPTSKERIEKIASEAEGFLYCVSSLGVTGVRSIISNEAEAMIRQVKSIKDIPCAIGFGISTPEQAGAIAAYSDGIIVGSAIIRIIAEHGSQCVPFVRDYVRSMVSVIS
jgi:tryptophan synthase alpha chain